MDPFLESLRSDGDRFVAVLRSAPPDTLVPSCPGWDLSALGRHMGEIHRWAGFAAEHHRRPADAELEATPIDDARLADWLATGLDRLIDILRAQPSNGPTWHPFEGPQVASIWPRRQAHELMIHRWDAEHAIGLDDDLDPEMAADGIDEYFGLIVPRVIARDARVTPTGRLLVRCTDVDSAWVVTARTGDVRVDVGAEATTEAVHSGIDEIAGPAARILLALWGRSTLAGGVSGPAAAEWLRFGGN